MLWSPGSELTIWLVDKNESGKRMDFQRKSPDQPVGSDNESDPESSGQGQNKGRRKKHRHRPRSKSHSQFSKTSDAKDIVPNREGNIPSQRVGDTSSEQNGNAAKSNVIRQNSSHRRPRTNGTLSDCNGIYSAIDLGTNNCRLLIARPTNRGFRVVDAFSRIVRLGEGIGQDGLLSDDAMDRAVEALKICAEKIDRRNVTCMRHVATEACRVASNTGQFIERIQREAGLNVEVITAAEEARLAVMGCQSLVAPKNHYALVFDIGGGSTELIWVRMRPNRQSEIHGWMSIPWGVINLSERFSDELMTAEDSYKNMIDEVYSHLHSFEKRHRINGVVGRRSVQFLGTSGTVTTLASLHLKLPRYIREKVDGAWMRAGDIRDLSRRVAMMPFEDRAAQPCIGHERADLVVAGCAILEAILTKWSVPSLRVADRGIREGILRGLMAVDPEPIVMSGRGRRSSRRRSRHRSKTQASSVNQKS